MLIRTCETSSAVTVTKPSTTSRGWTDMSTVNTPSPSSGLALRAIANMTGSVDKFLHKKSKAKSYYYFAIFKIYDKLFKTAKNIKRVAMIFCIFLKLKTW